jgi:hypothetical protein
MVFFKLPLRWRLISSQTGIGKEVKSLDKNPKGFFLMVEGSEIDWAGHDKSIIGVMQNETIGQVLWEVFIPTERPGL